MHDIGKQTLNGLIEDRCRQSADATALIMDDGVSIRFGELWALMECIDDQLFSAGCEYGRRVAVAMPQGGIMALSCLSLMCRRVCVPLNPAQTFNEAQYLLEEIQPDCLVTLAGYSFPGRSWFEANDKKIVEISPQFLAEVPSAHNRNASDSSPDSDSLILHTSGSTAQPKIVALKNRQLVGSIHNLCRSLELGPHDRCLNMMPQFHIGALLDLVMAPLSVGGSSVIMSDATAENFWRCFEQFHPSWFQAVPTMLQAITGAGERSTFTGNRLRLIRSVSSALPEALKQKTEKHFGVPVIEIYGMTETAGVIASPPLDAAREHSVGVSAGPDITVVDSFGNPVVSGQKGEILVKGPTVIGRYEGSEQINRENFTGGWLRTGDQGYLDDEGYLYLTGRIKEIINRGGEKISPLELDQLLLELPGIKEAAAFAVDHESLGEEVAVAVVKDGEAAIDEEKIKNHLSSRLADYKLPRKVYFLSELPRAAGGKLRRHLIKECIESESSYYAKAVTDRPLTSAERQIADIWHEVLDIAEVGPDQDFFDLGGDSLKAATVMARMEKISGARLPTSMLLDEPTVAGLAKLVSQTSPGISPAGTENPQSNLPDDIEQKLQQLVGSWRGRRPHANALMAGFNTMGSEPNLFWCCQGADEIEKLVDQLGSEQPVYAMRSLYHVVKRGKRNNRELARRYLSDLTRVQPDGPYYIGGFCEGALVAFEIAGLLRGQGREVALLALHEEINATEYSGRLALFFCDNGRHSPFGKFGNPQLGWSKLFQGQVSLYRYPWGHQACYEPENLCCFAAQLAAEMRLAANAQESPARLDLLPVDAGGAEYTKRKIAGSVQRRLSRGKTFMMDIELTNNSHTDWLPTQQSGVALNARWINLKGEAKLHLAGYAPIEHVIKPGEMHTFNVEIQSPATSGLRCLEIDLAEEGIAWLSQGGRAVFRKWAWIKR